jgi:hypothetical protein
VKHLLAILLILLPAVALRAEDAEITVDPSHILAPVSPYLTGVCMEDVNHEIYGGLYSQMVFGESFQEPEKVTGSGVSGCWTAMHAGTIDGKFELIRDHPFVGAQSQRMIAGAGTTEIGLANAGLNGQGMTFHAHSDYEGELWARAQQPTELQAVLVDDDFHPIAEANLTVQAGDWQRIPFVLHSRAEAEKGRFEIKLTAPGPADLGYVFLQRGTGPLRPFLKRLPVRYDVMSAMMNQGITVVRYGGSMINDPAYRWKNMIGPRAKRPPTHGTWYPYSSNGWGIPDFCAFCDAAGFLGIPAFNMGEMPQDMADFLEYAHGGPETKWGAQRMADIQNFRLGQFAAPLKVRIIELGNEEQVNDAYWQKFEPIARAIWSRDPKMILTVGDFDYGQVITDPFHVTGGHVDSLAVHQKILALAKEYGAEVWFDVHIGTQEVPPPNAIDPLLSYIRALQGLSNGAKFHVVTYELNADRHDLTRALANARMIGLIERVGAEPVVTSANALQVDGQNDNGWNQGLLFMTPDKVWLQPPGYVTQMISRNRLANVVQADSSDPNLDVTATASVDGGKLVLQIVNAGPSPVNMTLRLANAKAVPTAAHVLTLTGPLDGVNTAAAPDAITPKETEWTPHFQEGTATCMVPAHSFTVMRFK